MEEIRVVALFPDEDQVGCRHENGHELASGGRARERICADAEPAAVITGGVVRPELLDLPDLLVSEDYPARLDPALLHPRRLPVSVSANQAL
jgi:hypothetical protein